MQPPRYGPDGPLRPLAARTSPAPVRAVLFDFSGTLFQIRDYTERLRALLPGPVPQEEMEHLLDALSAALDEPEVAEAQRGRDTSARAHRTAFLTWYARVPRLAAIAEELYGQLRSPSWWLPYAETGAVLGALSASGVRVGVVSDIGWRLPPTFRHRALDRYVGAWVHSFEHGTEKPDPLLFRHACAELGVAEDETLMVGDNPVKDGGAVAARLRSYVLPTGAAPGAHRGLDAVLRLADVTGAVGGPRSSDTATSR
ncbi:HAD family hydrolase [Streptomyces xiaopingdaonensis]|uniref:HAD family hydrolase n=1 Tax=Streptomyces xiaopingdaonensis TaxID=1565415 RepID=UPI0002E410F6|nr:HAD-IA family hydrolase [Streptomyces xiaopingdaonensis]